MAEVLGLREPTYGWHQGATLRSLTVIEEGAEVPPAGPGPAPDDTAPNRAAPPTEPTG